MSDSVTCGLPVSPRNSARSNHLGTLLSIRLCSSSTVRSPALASPRDYASRRPRPRADTRRLPTHPNGPQAPTACTRWRARPAAPALLPGAPPCAPQLASSATPPPLHRSPPESRDPGSCRASDRGRRRLGDRANIAQRDHVGCELPQLFDVARCSSGPAAASNAVTARGLRHRPAEHPPEYATSRDWDSPLRWAPRYWSRSGSGAAAAPQRRWDASATSAAAKRRRERTAAAGGAGASSSARAAAARVARRRGAS